MHLNSTKRDPNFAKAIEDARDLCDVLTNEQLVNVLVRFVNFGLKQSGKLPNFGNAGDKLAMLAGSARKVLNEIWLYKRLFDSLELDELELKLLAFGK